MKGRRRQIHLLNLKLHPLGMYLQRSALITKQRELLTIKEFSAGLTALANLVFGLVKNHNSDNINLSKVLRASQAFSVEESISESLSKDLETNLRFASLSLASGSINKLRSEIS